MIIFNICCVVKVIRDQEPEAPNKVGDECCDNHKAEDSECVKKNELVGYAILSLERVKNRLDDLGKPPHVNQFHHSWQTNQSQ